MSTHRTMTAVGSNKRITDFNPAFSLNGADNDHASHASALGNTFGNSSTWGGNIWGPSATSSFASTAREASRPRESAHLGTSDAFETRRGSRALVASSESDNFPSPWNNTTRRSSATSPPRTRSIAPGPPAQPLTNGSSSAYYPARNHSIAQGPVAKPTKQQLNPMSKAFTAHQPSDSLSNELSRYSLTQSDHVNGYSELSTPWSDAASVHSPGDDRQSLPASEYFGTSSAAPSRSGSLPPSRHGEPVNFPDKYARYVQQNQRQPVSISAVSQSHFQERNGSFQGDSLPMLGQMGREQIEDESLLHRASFTANGFPQLLDYPAADAGVSRENNANAFSSQRADSYSNAGSGTYTPDSQWQGHTTDPNAQFRTFRFNNRGTPNGTMVRQSPQYSNAHTPPHFNQYQVQQLEQAFTNSANLAMIERRIAGVASVQQQQMVLQNRPPINYQQYPVQHVQVVPNMNLAPSNIRPYYTEMSNAVAFQPAYVQPIQNGMAMAPSGPKDDKPYCPKSPFLLKFRDDFAKGTKKYTLKEIQGYLVEFGGDQSGSRFIQNELTKANSEERARVFDEIYPNAVQLMQDVFGNYVIQKFFELGDQGQKRALGNSMKRKMLDLSTHGYGCRVVQKAFEHILVDQQAELVSELKAHVLECVKNQNGNHVIQKAIERIPPMHIQFIIDAFRGSVGALSVEQYGCRVVQRLLEHCNHETKRFILDEIHAEGDKILSHNYGNYVTQHVLQYGLPEDRTRVIELVKKDLVKYSGHKFASNVVEKCLAYGTEQQRRDIMLKIKERNEKGESNISKLIKDQYGNYVIQKVLDLVNYENFVEFAAALRPEIEANRKNIATKQLTAMEEKLRRFDQAPPALPQRNSMSSTAESLADVPSLTDAQSPQSTDVPSGPSSTVEDLTHTQSLEKTLRPLAALRIATDS